MRALVNEDTTTTTPTTASPLPVQARHDEKTSQSNIHSPVKSSESPAVTHVQHVTETTRGAKTNQCAHESVAQNSLAGEQATRAAHEGSGGERAATLAPQGAGTWRVTSKVGPPYIKKCNAPPSEASPEIAQRRVSDKEGFTESVTMMGVVTEDAGPDVTSRLQCSPGRKTQGSQSAGKRVTESATLGCGVCPKRAVAP